MQVRAALAEQPGQPAAGQLVDQPGRSTSARAQLEHLDAGVPQRRELTGRLALGGDHDHRAAGTRSAGAAIDRVESARSG